MPRWLETIGRFMRKRGMDDFEVVYHHGNQDGPRRVEIVRFMEPVHYFCFEERDRNRLVIQAAQENSKKEKELLAKAIPRDLVRKVRRLVPPSIRVIVRDDVQVGCPYDD